MVKKIGMICLIKEKFLTLKNDASNFIGIEWDINVNGHSGQNQSIGKEGHCYNLLPDCIKKIEDESSLNRIRWYSKGKFSDWDTKNKN